MSTSTVATGLGRATPHASSHKLAADDVTMETYFTAIVNAHRTPQRLNRPTRVAHIFALTLPSPMTLTISGDPVNSDDIREKSGSKVS